MRLAWRRSRVHRPVRVAVRRRGGRWGPAASHGRRQLPGLLGEFLGVFTPLAHKRAGPLLVTGDALFTSRRNRHLALAARHAMPTIHSQGLLVHSGDLMSYGTSIMDASREVGVYAGRILKGERAGDLPVIQGAKFELLINRKTATTLGLTIPPTVLARTDGIIDK